MSDLTYTLDQIDEWLDDPQLGDRDLGSLARTALPELAAKVRELEADRDRLALIFIQVAHQESQAQSEHEGGCTCGGFTEGMHAGAEIAYEHAARITRLSHENPPCWCGAPRGPRTPADPDGLGCLGNIRHALADAPKDAAS